MSMLRLLSTSPPRGGPSSPSKRTRSAKAVRVDLHVPAYGAVFMPFPNPIPDPFNIPRQDKELSGDLEIEVPQGYGKIKCKAIRVGVRTSCTLDMGLDRGREEDTLWLGKAELIGGTSDGVVIEEGVQRFTFTMIIPGNLATHDFHPGHRVDNTLFAEVEGLEESFSPTSWLRRNTVASSSRAGSSRGVSPTSSGSLRSRGSRSPSPLGSDSSRLMTPPQTLTIMRQEATLPQPPAYDLNDSSSKEAEDVPWLVGTAYSERELVLIYNPDPAGGVNTLDTIIEGDTPSIGPYSITFTADEWCIAALLKGKLVVPAPSPKVTIYYINIALEQRADITSPREGSRLKVERHFPIFTHGSKPPLDVKTPPINQPAIWRGAEAGGSDNVELALDGQGHLPNDFHGRPSTLEGVESPIRVSHKLRTEIWFSVSGEDAHGNVKPKVGLGDLRVLRVDKHVTVPACSLISDVLLLPQYGYDKVLCPNGAGTGNPSICPLCKTPSNQQFCKTCPLTSVPHPRHDHPKNVVGTSNGVCPSCTSWIIPSGCPLWRDCACGMLRGEIINRMKRVTVGEREEQEAAELVRGRRGREEKAEAERSRGDWNMDN